MGSINPPDLNPHGLINPPDLNPHGLIAPNDFFKPPILIPSCPQFNCIFYDECNCEPASYLIGNVWVCERCYNLINHTHKNLIEVKNTCDRDMIFKLNSFVSNDDVFNFNGAIVHNDINRQRHTYIFKTYAESISIYHPKFINVNPDYSCYICGQSKEPENHLYCWCSRLVSQIYTKFYFPKASLIKWIESNQGIFIPKDIINVILDYFNEICKIQNYADNNLSQIDESKYIEPECDDIHGLGF